MSYPEIETNYGRIRGLESSGIHTFRGIPFAAPVAGIRRFLPPSAPEPWSGVRDCTHYGEAVPQISLPMFSFINLAAGRLGEDCLSVSVWTPGLDDARRPVLVWIHGGGFLIGAGSTPMYNGRALARRGDAVVVTINYRLGALGYGHLGTIFGEEFAESTNLGVRDQIAALEWVRDHIERFGGDPENVTVFGQSAGAMSTCTLLASPRARSLFRRVICMSGAGSQVLERDVAEGVAREFVSRLGGPPPSHRSLAQIPMSDILHAQNETMAEMANICRLMVFTPFVDGEIVTEQPLDAVRAGATRDVEIMTGTTLEEWKLFRMMDPGVRGISWDDVRDRFGLMFHESFPGAPSPERAMRLWRDALQGRSAADSPNEAWCAFQSGRVFHHPCAQLAEAQDAAGGLAYRYLVTWRAPAMRRALGAAHAIDVPFVFGAVGSTLALPLTGFSGAAQALEQNMQTAFLRFAECGNPAHDGLPEWSTYDAEARATMILGREFLLDDGPLERERVLFEEWMQPLHDDRIVARPGG